MIAADFPPSLRTRFIRAYPVIAQMTADEEATATAEERDEAFSRVVANRNLRRTFEMYLADHGITPTPPPVMPTIDLNDWAPPSPGDGS